MQAKTFVLMLSLIAKLWAEEIVIKDPLFIHNQPQIEIKADYKAEPTFLEKAVTVIMTPIAVGAMAYEGAGAAVGATVTGAAGVMKDAVSTNDNNETKDKEQ